MKENLTLKTKIIAVIATIVFFISLLIFLSFWLITTKYENGYFHKNINAIKNIISYGLYNPMKDYNSNTINDLLTGVMKEDHIYGIELYFSENQANEMFTAGKVKNAQNKIDDIFIPINPQEQERQLTLSEFSVISNDGIRTIGKLKIYIDDTIIEQNTKHMMWIIFGMIFLLVIVFFALLYFPIYFIFLKPMKELIEEVRRNTKLPVGMENKIHSFTERQDEFYELAMLLNTQNSKTSDITGKLTGIQRKLKLTAEKNIAISQEFEDSTNTEAAAIEEISATLVESAASIKNISNSTKSSSEKLSDGANKAKSSFELIDEITNSIDEISTQSKKIQNSLALIYDVTNETEMLAMNASIEAAKAGEFGKGFSVVANEIRKLAEKSQETAADIDQKINRNNKIVEHAQKFIIDSQNTLKDILETTVASDQFLSQISTAITETSTGQSELIKSIDNINTSMSKIVSLVDVLKSSTKEINTISGEIDQMIAGALSYSAKDEK